MSVWPAYRQLKKANEKHNPDLFFTTWTEVVAQENVGLDSTLGNVMMLELIKMAKKLPERHEKWTAMIIDCLEDIRLKLSLNPDSSSWYVAGLRLAMRYSEIYSNFDKFVEWWGPENLAPKDYRPYRAADGTEIMPLAERLWLAWGEHLLKQEDLTNDQIDSFLERIRQVSRAHHDYTWLDYIEAKMLLQADRAPEALPILRKFLTQKPREWWAWSALGQIAFQQNDYEKAIACYGMALSLQEDENELTETREELAKIWLISGEPEMAKRELTLAIHAYSRANKEIPEILLEMANMEAISSVDAASENEERKYQRLIPIARQWAVEGFPSISGLLITILQGGPKRGNSALVQVGLERILKVPAGLVVGHAASYTPVKITFLQNTEKILLLEVLEEYPEAEYIRHVRDQLVRHQRGFGFIGDLYIPHNFIEQIPPGVGQYVEAIAHWNYHKKKDQWQWRTFEIRINGEKSIRG